MAGRSQPVTRSVESVLRASEESHRASRQPEELQKAPPKDQLIRPEQLRIAIVGQAAKEFSELQQQGAGLREPARLDASENFFFLQESPSPEIKSIIRLPAVLAGALAAHQLRTACKVARDICGDIEPCMDHQFIDEQKTVSRIKVKLSTAEFRIAAEQLDRTSEVVLRP
jgi:hypothetical protein